jgi:adenine-specific DNA-methyltransferase
MKHLTSTSSDFQSINPIGENLRRLKDLFPDAFLDDGQIDFTILRQLLGDNTITGEERYGLNWHGKRLARHLALMPSTGTLLPKPEQSVNWENTKNIFIEGDNLQVLQLLTKSFSGRVGVIYIDPPYNQDADVVYNDDYVDPIQNYKMLVGQIDSDGRQLTTARSTSGRLHTKWLQMMYPRLKLAR